MPNLTRKEMEAVYKMFDEFVLEDQRRYYRSVTARHRLASSQVNRLRAWSGFMTGFSSALAGLIVQMFFLNGAQCTVGEAFPPVCTVLQGLTLLLTITAIVAPALGAAFNTLADLYQWDRMISIFDAALENIEVADAQSPLDDMDTVTYRASLRAYIEGTLSVMRDETSQWGQLVRPPQQLETFVAEEIKKAEAETERQRTELGIVPKKDTDSDTAKPDTPSETPPVEGGD